jgi:hypothetical protein
MRILVALLLSLICSSAYAGDFTTPGSRAKGSLPDPLKPKFGIEIGDQPERARIEIDDDDGMFDFQSGGDSEDDRAGFKFRGNARFFGNEFTFEGDWQDAPYFFVRTDGFSEATPMPNGTNFGGFKFTATDVAGSGNPIDYVQFDATATLANDTGEVNVKVLTSGVFAYEYIMGGTSFRPYSNDGAALGDADQMWSDLYLASGAVQNWNNGDCLLTHSSNTLTLTGCAFAGTDIVDSTAITNSTIVEADLNAIDVPNDEECLTYEASNFEWQACGSQTPWTSNIDADGFNLDFADNTGIRDDDGDELLIFQDNGGTDVNWLEIQNAASGANPSFLAAGGDSNIGFNFLAKGNAGFSLTTPRFMMDLGQGGGANLTIKNSSTSSFGPGIAVYHDTANPAAGDTTFFFTGQGEDSAGNSGDVAGFDIKWIDPTSTLEDGEFIIKAVVAGAATAAQLKVSDGVIVGSSSTYPGVGNLLADGDLTSTDDVVVGDDVLLGNTGRLDFNSGDVLVTHGSNLLTISGGDLTVPTLNVSSGITMGTSGINWNSNEVFLNRIGADNIAVVGGHFSFQQDSATISSGAIGISRQLLVVDTEGAAATDTLDTIAAPGGGAAGGGTPFWVQAANDARTVVIAGDSTGNIVAAGGTYCMLDDAEDIAMMVYNQTLSEWVVVSCNQTQNDAITVAASDETTPITASTGKIKFRMPYAFNVDGVRCSLSTAQNTTGAGSIFTVDINEGDADADGGNPVSILSTKVTIDDDETTSLQAAAAPVLSDVVLANNAEMTIDVDAIGDSADAAGLKCSLIGHQ